MLSMFLVVPLVKPLVAKFGKKEISVVGMAIAAIIYIVIVLLKITTTMPFIILVALAYIAMGLYNIVTWAFITDVIDYHEYQTS